MIYRFHISYGPNMGGVTFDLKGASSYDDAYATALRLATAFQATLTDIHSL